MTTATEDQTRRIEARARFNRELMMEALDEAAFLYAQSKLLGTSEQHRWTDAEGFETRLETQLDLLEDPNTFPELASIENQEDPGALYAIIRALCFHGRLEDLLEWLGALELKEPAQTLAVGDALREGVPLDWMEAVLDALWLTHRELACRLMGIRQFYPAGERLLLHPEITPAWAWALGRLQLPGTQEMLKDAVRHEDPQVAEQAAIALLRMGEGTFLRNPPPGGPGWFPMAQALAHKEVSRGATPQHLLALGIAGDPEVVPTLVHALADPELAPAAAKALYALTGAPLRETVFVPEETAPIEEKAPAEQEAPKPGTEEVLIEQLIDVFIEAPMAEAPKAAPPKAAPPKAAPPKAAPPAEVPAEPEGEEQERLSQNPEHWAAWWEGHRSAFPSGTPCRLGKPSTPLWLLETLASPDTPQWLRALTLEELQICHGIDLPFDLDCQVRTQKEGIQKSEGLPVSPLARRLTLQEGWKTAMIRAQPGVARPGEAKPAAAQPEVPKIQERPAPPPISPSVEREGRRTGRVHGIKANNPWGEPSQAAPAYEDLREAKAREAAFEQPQPAPNAYADWRKAIAQDAVFEQPESAPPGKVKEGWKTAMIRGVKAQGPGTDQPASSSVSPLASPSANRPAPSPAGGGPVKEGWKTAMIRGVKMQNPATAVPPAAKPAPLLEAEDSQQEGWKTVMIRIVRGGPKAPGDKPAQPAPASRVEVKEGWKTAMIRGVKVQNPDAVKPVDSPAPPAKEGWKTGMVRSIQSQEENQGQASPSPGKVKEGWKTAMIRGVKSQERKP